MEKHLAVDQLAGWTSLPHAHQVRYAYDLSTGCEVCWSALSTVQPTEPRRLRDPFLRAVARVCHPKVDLSLPSQAIRPLLRSKLKQGKTRHRFRPGDFPILLLQESIAVLGSRELACPEGEILDFPFALAGLLMETPESEAAGVDLLVNVYCALVDIHYSNRDADKARGALDSAWQSFTKSCDPLTEVNLGLANLKVACIEDRTCAETAASAIAVNNMLSLIQDDPVRRFEITLDLFRALHDVEIADHPDDASCALSHLDFGAWSNEIHRLNALFHQATYAIVAAAFLPDLPKTAASSLENHLGSLALYGDYYSLGRYYELLGRLRSDAHSLDQALKTYGALELEDDFLDAWKVLDKLDKQSRSRISDRALHAFGQEVAHRMARVVSGFPDPAQKGEVLVLHLDNRAPARHSHE